MWFTPIFALFGVAASSLTEEGNQIEESLLKGRNFEQLFVIGKDSYLANDWKNCVKYMELSLRDFRRYQDAVTKCKIGCRRETRHAEKLFEEDVEGLHYYEEAVKNTLCIMRCKRRAFGKERVEQVSIKVLEAFDAKLPYDYLQLCYYQVSDYQNAASAAFTNLVYNAGDQVMTENLDYYVKNAGADRNNLVNFESKESDYNLMAYVTSYLAGSDGYRGEDWATVRDKMEAAVAEYLLAEEECRFNCEKPFDMGWFPDFITSVANHFTFCLRCKRKCPHSLSNLNGKYVEDIFSLMFHYLQISYYHIKDLKKAAECVESFLLFHPGDKEMLQNKEFYLSEPGTDKSWFKAREEAVSYYKRELYETKLMTFVETSFNFGEDDEPLTPVVQDAKSESIDESVIGPVQENKSEPIDKGEMETKDNLEEPPEIRLPEPPPRSEL